VDVTVPGITNPWKIDQNVAAFSTPLSLLAIGVERVPAVDARGEGGALQRFLGPPRP
jgi:hypothetical protein